MLGLLPPYKEIELLKIYPYMNGSKSAKALAQAIGCLVLKHESDRVFKTKQLVINWGSSKIKRPHNGWDILNAPLNVSNAANKLTTFELFKEHEVPTVEWTTDAVEAAKWLMEGNPIVARFKLSGHSGDGLVIYNTIEEMEKEGERKVAPLYTKYTKKKDEYRIHVFQGEVIFQQRKARKKDVPDEKVNWQVRNLAGGFIFANDGVVAPDVVQQAAVLAVQALGLDFGAADVGFKDGVAYVYEVNTACGLEGRNLEAYVNKFREFL